MISKIRKFITNPRIRFSYLTELGLTRWMSDEQFLKKEYYLAMGKPLNLDNPQTFNEKLQWLKIHNRKPEYTTMVDKYAAKQYVADRIGSQYIIPTLGVWDHFDDIDFDVLPDQFVLKCTHDSGGLVICKDKSRLNKKAAKRKIEHCLRRKYYYVHREWPYKDVKPRIIAEKYMADDFDSKKLESLTDYKFFCFDGTVDSVMLCMDRNTGDTKFYFFSPDWKLLRINKRGKAAPSNFTLPKPICMDEMITLAQELSKGLPYVRIDLYQCAGRVYFGEITFFPDSGFDPNILPETDLAWGEKLILPKKRG